MAQRRQGFDERFLDNDVDLKIAHPSPNAEIYMRSGGGMSWSMIFVLLILLGGGAGGAFYYGFRLGVEEGQSSLPPVVLADRSPLKRMPNEVPGGVQKKPEDLNIYDVARGRGAGESGPPDNATGALESLIATIENAVFGKSEAEEEAEQLEQLKQRGIEVSPPRPDLNRAPSAREREANRAVLDAPLASAPKPQAKPKPLPKKQVAQRQTRQVAPSSGRALYMVQVAAARSRGLARGSYSELQNTFPDLLGARDSLILRADLGKKGIFYRVNVAGFSGIAAATDFCNELKFRGQDCFVRKQP